MWYAIAIVTSEQTTMLIYRFETCGGRGIYDCGLMHNTGIVLDRSRHPGPRTDDGIRQHWNEMSIEKKDRYFFGFSSLHKLRRWFHKHERKLLANEGVVLRVYEVDDTLIISSKNQDIFPMEKAKTIGKLDTITLTPITDML